MIAGSGRVAPIPAFGGIVLNIKSAKLVIAEPPLQYVHSLARRYQLTLPLGNMDAALLCASADLPLIHRDPFDRILIATAIAQNLTILTSNRIIPTYPGVRTLW